MAHPLDLLHGVGELWPVIASKMGFQELYNLSDAHPYWSTMLQRRRSNFLIQLCLPLLTERELGLPDLLTLRLVSKAWKQGVDHYLRHEMYEEIPFMNEKKHSPSDFDVCAWDRDNFIASQRMEVLVVDPQSPLWRNRPRQISAWLDKIELTPSPSANPILSREAIFYIRSLTVQMQHETIDIVNRCLRAHGRHLLRCTFEMSPGASTIVTRPLEREYSQLRDWLHLVPNLLSLEVDFGQVVFRDRKAELGAHIQDNPLPELPNLSRLRVERLPPALFQALVRKYNHVETLELKIIGIDAYPLEPVQLEGLKTLKLQLHGTNALVAFQQLGTESCLVNLHTLEIKLNGSLQVRWGVLIDFLNSNFGAARRLVKVALHMPMFSSNDRGGCTRLFVDSQTCRLRLPGVEQLKLVGRNLFGLEFLLPMRHTLKKLAILNYHEKVMEECQQHIQWNGWVGTRLLTSNIWEAFPQLNFIRAQHTRYGMGMPRIRSRGWTYRRKEGGAVINMHSYGEAVTYDENIDWEELANGIGDAEDA